MISSFFTTSALSSLFTGIMTIWSQSREDLHNERLAALQRDTAIDASRIQAARRGDGKTKSIMALSITFVYVFMKLAPLIFPLAGLEAPEIVYSWNEWQSGFLFFSDGKEIMKTITVGGIHFNPLDAEILGTAFGYYFGRSTTKRRR